MWETQEPRFDESQFAGRKVRKVSQDTRLAFSDVHNMHVERRKTSVFRKKPIPLWSQNDADLCRVVLLFCERTVGIRRPQGTNQERLEAIREKAKAILANKETLLRIALEQHSELKGQTPEGHRDFSIQVQNFDTQIQVLRRGLPELATAVATYSYRLGWDSTQVAQELRLRPPAIRQWLRRMNMAHAGARERRYKQALAVRWPEDKVRTLFQLRVMGYTLAECAQFIGVSSQTVVNRWKQEFDLTVSKLKQKALSAPKEPSRRKKWTTELLQRLFVLHVGCHLPISECARRLNCGSSAAWWAWRKYFLGSTQRNKLDCATMVCDRG